MARDSLGEFEQFVLLACWRLGEGAYAVPIVQEIELRSGRAASHAAVYIALRRLEKKGLVQSALGDPTPARGGRSKRFFTVTPDAVDQLRESRAALLAMWEDLEPAAL
jgi:PadR family transcriptional regulator